MLTSRRGRETLRRTSQTAGLRTLRYLERLPDLTLTLEAVDASDYEGTQKLIKSLQKPLGGCFLMSLVLSDKAFINQTEDDFERVFEAKTVALQNLVRSTDMTSLDFLVSFSSVAALFGSAGQSNYTRWVPFILASRRPILTCSICSASAALEGLTSKYPNAFSIVVPGITDNGWLVRDQLSENSRSGHLLKWGISTQGMYCISRVLRLSLTCFQIYAIVSLMASVNSVFHRSSNTYRT